jgi:hypothetical protein
MMEKPSNTDPIFFFFSEWQNMVITTPMTARKGEKELGLMRVIRIDSPSRAFKDSTQAVAVVPRFAPMIKPMALASSIIPELTSPTDSTVIAEEDCTTAVTIVPKRKAKNRFFVTLPMKRFNAPPVIAVRESLKVFIPVKNNANPASIDVITVNISMKDIFISFFVIFKYLS